MSSSSDNGNLVAPQQPVPKTIGSYTIEGLFRQGGMALLYLATHPTTKEPVIIKTLKPQYSGNAEVIRKFNNEAKILTLADHPNIVTLYDHEEWEGGPYIALEFIQGESLHTIIEHSPVSLKKAVEIILEIAYALCHLHTLGVIHRDLKPENILVTDQNTIKLIDLGVAQMLSEVEGPRKLTGQQPHLVGTPIYMSPEQHSNPDAVSYASDIYSLGIIAYELVMGKLSHGQVHLAQLPRGLQKILAKTMRPSPQDRYHDVVDFITDLSAYLNSASLVKERKSVDLLSELSDHLQQAQTILLPGQAPQWANLETGVGYSKGLSISGIYYDFFVPVKDRYDIIMVEPVTPSVEGVLYTAVLRGIIRTLFKTPSNPTSLINALNEAVFHEGNNQLFWVSYVVLLPQQNELQYISCGPSKLWIMTSDQSVPRKVTTDNPALGLKSLSEVSAVTMSWHVGDALFVPSMALCGTSVDQDIAMDEAIFANSLQTLANQPTQKQVEAILRRASSHHKRRLLAFIALKRHGHESL